MTVLLPSAADWLNSSCFCITLNRETLHAAMEFSSRYIGMLVIHSRDRHRAIRPDCLDGAEDGSDRPGAGRRSRWSHRGGVSATGYALHCTDDSLAFVALWYGGTIALCTVAGATLGLRLLRW